MPVPAKLAAVEEEEEGSVDEPAHPMSAAFWASGRIWRKPTYSRAARNTIGRTQCPVLEAYAESQQIGAIYP